MNWIGEKKSDPCLLYGGKTEGKTGVEMEVLTQGFR